MKPFGKWDRFVVGIVNLLLKITSRRYQETLAYVIHLGMDEADEMLKEFE